MPSSPGIRRLLALALLLPGCDSGEPNRFSLSEFEGPEGEAVVRHLVAVLPPLDPEVPKSYCVVKGPGLFSTSMEFVGRLGDLKLRFVSGEVLTVRQPDRMVIDPGSNLPPVQLQIMEMKRTGDDRVEAVGAWAYKKTFERRRLVLRRGAGGWEVVSSERTEGNHGPS